MSLKDRIQAGEMLADQVSKMKVRFDAVIGIPRGGVPVAARIASRLAIPLHAILSKKISHPDYPEYAIGAVCMDEIIIGAEFQATFSDYITTEVQRINTQTNQSNTNDLSQSMLEGRSILLVDDGAATGFTVLAAIKALKKMHPSNILVCLPFLPQGTAKTIRQEADLISLSEVVVFNSVGSFYEQFEPVTNEEVSLLLDKYSKKTSNTLSK